MSKEIGAIVKLQVKGGAANPAPPIGPALGAKGVNIMELCNKFNAKNSTADVIITPVVITVYSDKSFTLVTKTPPAPVLLLKAAKLEKGSKESNRSKVGKVTSAQVKEIAALKMPDLNAASLEAAMSMVAGTARSMGLTVEG